MRAMRVLSAGGALAVALSACSSSLPGEQASTSVAALTVADGGSASDVVPGYKHTLAKSAFVVGAAPVERDEFGMHKVIGDQGVFATRASGMVTAIANGTAAALQVPPIADNASHNAAVRDYLVQAGLPADQIGTVEDREVVGAPATSGNSALHGTVKFRVTRISRQIHGVPVAESFAWVRMNANGTVVDEQIYWPDIPISVVQDADALTVSLSNASALASFTRLLPPHGAVKGIAIHHTTGVWDGPFAAAAVYDVLSQTTDFPAIIHVDASGAIRQLPHELPFAFGAAGGTTVKP